MPLPRFSRVSFWAILFCLGACSNGRGSLEEPAAGSPPPTPPPPTSTAQDTFTIGGAVTGLAGSGLVLQLNGGNDVAVTADGPFTFAPRLPNGGAFAVTVRTQPTAPSQSCTVTAGTGVVAASNVSNITVTCVRGQFTLGGSVSGLTGTGLVLQNKGGDDIAIASNGAFAFPTPLVSAESYNVAVRSQPVGQTCFVRNATGTITANVVNVEVTCAADRISIGGEVVGLGGSGLILQLNGAQDLAVPSNGRFAFESGVAVNSSYQVSVRASPSAPTQTCEITNGRGTATVNVTDVRVTCTTAQFVVGGSVAGLTASGLRLQLNDANDLPIASDGRFMFTPRLPSGTPYRVRVSAQPASQSCSVASGSGTVAAADVSNVRVTCASNTFAVRGSVSGLLGRGLVLQNNGDDPVEIDGNDGFAFPAQLASGSTYDVTVRTQPSEPNQTCSVANGRGTITNANVTNVVVSCSTSDFTIGGTVRNLTGSQLVLRNNGTDELRVDASGPFTFDGALPAGAAYDVTIAEQPRNPDQSCSVSSGKGVVRSANVTTVSVQCSSASGGFLIGGEVSDLRGSGLVLQNNGVETLAIGANGRFNFPTRLNVGSLYLISVATQPTNPSQTCTVRNGFGIVSNSDIENVRVRCSRVRDDDDDDEDD